MTWITVAERETVLNAGPGIIGQLAAIARGTYTDIVAIVAPSEALAGELVNVEAWVQNLTGYPIYISTSGKFDNTIFNLYPEKVAVGAGATHSFSGSFLMPNHDVRVYVWSYYWIGTEPYLDDESYVDIALKVAPPVEWVLLAQRSIALTIAPEWVLLAERSITLDIAPEWVLLAERAIVLEVAPEWVFLAEKAVTLEVAAPPVEWVLLAEKEISIGCAPLPPGYELIQHTIYPWAYTFEGDAETCVFEFKLTPEQIPGTEWLGQRIVDSLVSELEKEGSRLLELKVYRDTTPTWWTNYRVEVTATASPLVWNLIIIGVLAILFIVAIYFTIELVGEIFFKRKALDEETKKTFSRETLTAMILDLAPETPPETLEGMSDQELRDLLNRILAEGAPPISPWALLALAGLVVLGVGGAAVAFTMAKPKE